MDNSSFAQKKKDLIHKATGILLDEMESEERITLTAGRELANYILNQEASIVDDTTLKLFIDDLEQRSPLFHNLATEAREESHMEQKEEESKKVDQQKINNIQSQLADLGKFQ